MTQTDDRGTGRQPDRREARPTNAPERDGGRGPVRGILGWLERYAPFRVKVGPVAVLGRAVDRSSNSSTVCTTDQGPVRLT